jgi:uncharacterized protein (TIGR00290 family)
MQVTGLLTTVSTDRVSMHGVRRCLLQAQADALGLPLRVVELPPACSNQDYGQQMAIAVREAVGLGVEQMIFGDLFLSDVRAYREQRLAGTGLRPVFPLWGRPSADLAREMIASGLRAVVSCVDPTQAPAEIAGRWFDEDLLAELPDDADPCGEHGEFHTFVVDAPGFAHPVEVEVGETVERDGFVYTDLRPAAATPPTPAR